MNYIVGKFKGYLCKLGKHEWKYYHEKHECEIKGLDHIKELNVPIRECVNCGLREHHLMPKMGGEAYNWKVFKQKPGEKLFYTTDL